VIEPSAVAIVTGIIVSLAAPLLAGMLYIIRAEIRKSRDLLAVNTQATTAVHEQTIPDHGTSMRDAIDRIERRQSEDRRVIGERIEGVHRSVREVRTELHQHTANHGRSQG